MYEFLEYRVCDAMVSEPVTIAPETTLAEVESTFDEHDFNALPVIGPSRELLGLVTKLDVLKAFRFTEDHMFPPYEEIMQQRADSVMTRDVDTVASRTPLTRVLQKMLDTRNKSFPVVRGGELEGVIAREDVLAALRRAVGGERPRGSI